jgi:hypothetical protein
VVQWRVIKSCNLVTRYNTRGEKMEGQGIITKTLNWITHPSYTSTDPLDWFAFALILFLVGMLWSHVLRQISEA